MTRPLLSHRVIWLTGKGGVGKSTCAAAVAVAAAKRGKKVLLIDLGGSRAISEDLFESSAAAAHVPYRPLERHPSLWFVQLNADLALQDYLYEHLHARRLVKFATENKVLARLWRAAPSVPEMAMLNTVYRYERELDAYDVAAYDLLVVDLPASGHALAMLGVPRGILGMVRFGSLAQRATQIDALLHDEQRSALCLVTIAEELPINEAAELAESFDKSLDLKIHHAFVNAIAPEVFGDDETRALEALDGVGLLAAQPLLEVSRQYLAKRQRQQRRIGHLRERLQASLMEFVHMDRDGLALVEAMAQSVSA